MVKETVSSYRGEKLVRARMAAEFENMLKQEAPELKQKYRPDNSDHIITICGVREGLPRKVGGFLSLMNRLPFFSTFAKKVDQEINEVGYVNLQMKRVVVVDRKCYDALKRVAERIPWLEEIERDWAFDIDEDIPVEKETKRSGDLIVSGGSERIICEHTPSPKKRKKQTESSDMKPRYEKIEHKGVKNG
jgi:hypothetical protein